MLKEKILVVDDDPGISEMLKDLLEMYDYKVMLAEDAEKTSSLIEQENISLVILDMKIGGVEGTKICSDIKSNKNIAGVPVIMMSGFNAKAECERAGANVFMDKPFEMDDLLSKIKKLLS